MYVGVPNRLKLLRDTFVVLELRYVYVVLWLGLKTGITQNIEWLLPNEDTDVVPNINVKLSNSDTPMCCGEDLRPAQTASTSNA
jgi:hypothetical protein